MWQAGSISISPGCLSEKSTTWFGFILLDHCTRVWKVKLHMLPFHLPVRPRPGALHVSSVNTVSVITSMQLMSLWKDFSYLITVTYKRQGAMIRLVCAPCKITAEYSMLQSSHICMYLSQHGNYRHARLKKKRALPSPRPCSCCTGISHL